MGRKFMPGRGGKVVSLPTLPVTSCEGCGACCRHLGTPPGYAAFFGTWPADSWVWDRGQNPDLIHFEGLPAEARAALADYYRRVMAGETPDRTAGDATPCLWYDEAAGRCRHHEHRPTTCREFEVGEEDCLNHRRRLGIPLPVVAAG